VDYIRIYKEFIDDRRNKEAALLASGQYCEKHHIVPRSMGGSDRKENLISLTPEDHFFAHLQLAKAYGGRQWAAVWALVGMCQRGVRGNSLKWVIKRRKWIGKAREEYANSCKGKLGSCANLTIYHWINEKTGQEIIGTRHDLPVTHTAKKETSDYLSGKTYTTLSGWFTKDRFNSVEDLAEYRKKKQIEAIEHGRKIGKMYSGENHIQSKSVICLDTGIIYVNQADAAKKTGLRQPKISQCCSGERRETGGFRWAYFTGDIAISKKNWEEQEADRQKNNKHTRKVLNLSNKQEFRTIKDASKSIGVSPSAIRNVCAGKSKSSGGYRWAYA
jgi:hypothetical protein